VIGVVLAVLRAHTVERLRAVVRVATFPLMTPRYHDPRLWRAWGRLAWRGLWHPRPDSLVPFLNVREQVIRTRQYVERDAAQAGRVPGWRN
jgi:hypothetical protein